VDHRHSDGWLLQHKIAQTPRPPTEKKKKTEKKEKDKNSKRNQKEK
jgi:hypothetical protein